MGLHSGKFVLLANIRLEWKCITVANTLAYYVVATITAVKSVIV